MVTCFNKLFLNILDKHAPLIEKRGKHYNQPQWMNDEVMTAISKRDKFKAQGNFDQFKFWRRRANLTKVSAKKSYFTKNLQENKCNPKQMWKFINELNPKSRKPAPESECLRLKSLIENPQMWQTPLIAIFPLFHTNFYLKITFNCHIIQSILMTMSKPKCL